MQKYGRRLGILTTVPKTFVGSPRYMAHKYQDTIAMINKVGAPSIFATFTGDRNWPEIVVNTRSKKSFFIGKPRERPDLGRQANARSASFRSQVQSLYGRYPKEGNFWKGCAIGTDRLAKPIDDLSQVVHVPQPFFIV